MGAGLASPAAPRATNSLAATAPLVIGAGILFYMVSLREAHFSNLLQLAAGWGCIAILFAMSVFRKSRQAPWRFVFILVTTYLALRYLWWRSFETLIYTNPIDFVGMSALYIAEMYSLTLQLLSLFVNLAPMERGPVPLPANRAHWPTVDIFIPTYSEDEEISIVESLSIRIVHGDSNPASTIAWPCCAETTVRFLALLECRRCRCPGSLSQLGIHLGDDH